MMLMSILKTAKIYLYFDTSIYISMRRVCCWRVAVNSWWCSLYDKLHFNSPAPLNTSRPFEITSPINKRVLCCVRQ